MAGLARPSKSLWLIRTPVSTTYTFTPRPVVGRVLAPILSKPQEEDCVCTSPSMSGMTLMGTAGSMYSAKSSAFRSTSSSSFSLPRNSTNGTPPCGCPTILQDSLDEAQRSWICASVVPAFTTMTQSPAWGLVPAALTGSLE